MTGVVGIVGPNADGRWSEDFRASVDLLATGASRSRVGPTACLAVAAPSDPLLARRYVEIDDATVALAGHVVADSAPDWPRVLSYLRAENFAFLQSWSGRFALVVLDHEREQLYLITDRLGQYPLYLAQEDDTLAFSTNQASFCRWQRQPTIDPAWFHELFLLNFSASHGSFLRGVKRLPAATVLRVGCDGGEPTRWRYAEPYRPRPSDAGERAEVRRAIGVFRDRMGRYAEPGEHPVLGLTSGFDSRTVLAMCAGHPGLSGFTYGVADCEDIKVGRELARALGIEYSTVVFDEAFEARLGDLMVETVWLSGGLQSCTRATLLAAYRQLLAERPEIDTILSGVSGDQLFRGHGNVPSIVSSYVSALFEHGRFPASVDAKAAEMFVDAPAALDRLARLRASLTARYGEPRDTATHLGYLTYEVPAEYFAGEACLADQFADFRTPFCDRDIVALAYSSRLSSLTFSRYRENGHGNLQKNFLMANLIACEPRADAVPIQRRPVSAFAAGRPIGYFIASAASRLRATVTGNRPQPYLESWPRWFAGPMRARLESLLAPGARCEAIVQRPFIDRCLGASDPFWLNKLATAEIVLRLTDNGWHPDALLRAADAD